MTQILNSRMVEMTHVPVWTKRQLGIQTPRTCRVCGAKEGEHNGE